MLVIEHNLDVIKTADWMIDLGPEGGSGGGTIVAEGPPEHVATVEASHTGHFLRDLLSTPDPARRSAIDRDRDERRPRIRGSAHRRVDVAAMATYRYRSRSR